MFNADGSLALEKSHKKNDVSHKGSQYKILIVDDEESVHEVTLLALGDIKYNNRSLKILHAYSGTEARKIIKEEPDIAVIFLDVVMETENAGLELVKYIREELDNATVRIILRTGQPGQAPEEKVIVDYDINDYKNKAELTTQKLFTTLISSLRSYSQLIKIEKNQKGLEKVLLSTSSIVKIKYIDKFIGGLLEQVISLIHLDATSHASEVNAYIGFYKEDEVVFTAGMGKYENANTRAQIVFDLYKQEIKQIRQDEKVLVDDNYMMFFEKNEDQTALLLILDGNVQSIDTNSTLLDIFMRNAAITYDNILLTGDIKDSQKETIFLLSEMAEQRSKETGKHVKRVAYYAKTIAEELGLSRKEIEEIFAGAPMHDVGKIAIRDGVLKKPGPLTEEEFEEMKQHSVRGYELLSGAEKEIMVQAGVIAHEHHEKYDGTGYPRGLQGEEIHIYARIVALCDVFDALSNPRVYKEAWSLESVFEYLEAQRGKQFDPKVLDAFFTRKNEILRIHEEQKD